VTLSLVEKLILLFVIIMAFLIVVAYGFGLKKKEEET
jgi:cbb3-type cytochrome oxidase subunit 3